MPISIYPPTMQSTQPAFLHTTTQYPIYFTLQSITAFSDIGHIQIRIVRQSDNKSIIKTSKYPDGTIYKPPSKIEAVNNRYRVFIDIEDLQEPWQVGYLYKIQLRFGTAEMWKSIGEFATWKAKQIEDGTFSEWSTVMVIKAISDPNVFIRNAQGVREDVISTERTEPTLTPMFYGAFQITAESKESVDQFRFDLYDGKYGDSTGQLLETSGWLQHNDFVDGADQYRFKHILTNNHYYTVVYTVITVNGFNKQSDPYTFIASRSYYSELTGVSIKIIDRDPYCIENGCLRIYLTSEDQLSGTFVLTRSDETNNYEVWEDIKYFLFNLDRFDNSLIYDDFTIESGVKYRYAIQQENLAGLRTSPVYEGPDSWHYVDLEYGYLMRDGIQLRLQFNQKLSSFKHTVLASKQDTLGDKYTHILKNGYAYYAEFPISGTISFQMDTDQTFFKLETDGFHYKNDLVIPIDKLPDFNRLRAACEPGVDISKPGTAIDTDRLTIDCNLTENNIFVERRFREKAEEFLNDYTCKLYRSATEGNIVVCLMNVSLTPNATLGRMIFDFSATAYEVMDDTLENLNEYGIIDIGEFQYISSVDSHFDVGQLVGLRGRQEQNLYQMIKTKEEISVNVGYKLQLQRIRRIWIDLYPKKHFTAELTELEAKRALAIENEQPTDEFDAEIAELTALQNLTDTVPASTVTLKINGTTIKVLPGRIYNLKEPVNSLSLVYAGYPIIVNYVAELTQVEDLSEGVISAIDVSRIWGQISGVFSGTDEILKTYNFDYGPGEVPFRVFNGQPDKTVIYDNLGRVLVDNTNFNVYKTINIYNIIKEETRMQVESIYNVQGGFYQDKNGRWRNSNGSLYYEFSDLILFDIEADPGTKLYIGRQEDGSDKKEIMIGSTGRYVINPADGFIKYIALAKPQFCIINYKCLTNQMIMGGSHG